MPDSWPSSTVRSRNTQPTQLQKTRNRHVPPTARRPKRQQRAAVDHATSFCGMKHHCDTKYQMQHFTANGNRRVVYGSGEQMRRILYPGYFHLGFFFILGKLDAKGGCSPLSSSLMFVFVLRACSIARLLCVILGAICLLASQGGVGERQQKKHS